MNKHTWMIVTALMALLSVCLPARGQDEQPRFEAGPILGVIHQRPSLTGNTESMDTFLVGARLDYNWRRFLAFEGEYSFSPGSFFPSEFIAGGRINETTAGIKGSIRWKNIRLFEVLKTGIIHFTHTIKSTSMTAPGIQFTGRTFGAVDAGGGVEVYVSHHFLLRYDFTDMIVHHGNITIPTVFGPARFPSVTSHNFQFSTSVAFRF